MNKAGCMVVRRGDLFLAVSRKDSVLFGLPAGKWLHSTEGSSLAAIRETYEETGILVKNCKWILSRQDGEFFVDTFLALEWEGEISLTPEETGIVAWVSPDILVGDLAAFPEYNRNLLNTLGVRYGF